MTKPTPDQIQQACDLINAERGASHWIPTDYGRAAHITALADTIARAEKAEADLGEVDRIAQRRTAAKRGQTTAVDDEIANIAAPYRVETDPLVEAAESILQVYGSPGSDADTLALIAVALKRGLEIGRSA